MNVCSLSFELLSSSFGRPLACAYKVHCTHGNRYVFESQLTPTNYSWTKYEHSTIFSAHKKITAAYELAYYKPTEDTRVYLFIYLLRLYSTSAEGL